MRSSISRHSPDGRHTDHHGAWFIATIPVSTLTRALLFAGYSLLFLTLPTSLVGSFEQWEMLCRRTWWRPRTPLPAGPRDRHPKVSLHVPAYAEPPEVVTATLDALARLRYPNFEVLVIDNNTKDPGPSRPTAGGWVSASASSTSPPCRGPRPGR